MNPILRYGPRTTMVFKIINWRLIIMIPGIIESWKLKSGFLKDTMQMRMAVGS